MMDPKPAPKVKRPQTYAARRSTWVETPYIHHIRGLPCWIGELGLSDDESRCTGPIQPDHVPTLGAAGKFHEKVWPLCAWHHAQRHAQGIDTFCARYGITPEMLAATVALLRQEYEAKP